MAKSAEYIKVLDQFKLSTLNKYRNVLIWKLKLLFILNDYFKYYFS